MVQPSPSSRSASQVAGLVPYLLLGRTPEPWAGQLATMALSKLLITPDSVAAPSLPLSLPGGVQPFSGRLGWSHGWHTHGLIQGTSQNASCYTTSLDSFRKRLPLPVADASLTKKTRWDGLALHDARRHLSDQENLEWTL